MHRGQKAVYILPSREAMFDVRRMLTEENGGISDCLILGFDNLERIITRSQVKRDTLNNGEVRSIIRGLLATMRPPVFAGVIDKPGLTDGLVTAIKSLKRQYISPADFNHRISGFEGIVQDKCQAVSHIYQAYEEYKEAHGSLDIDDLSWLAINNAAEAPLFNTTGVIVIDGFINIDAVNVELLREIAATYPEIDFLAHVPFRNVHNEDFLRDEVLKDLEQLGFECVNDNSPAESEPAVTSLARELYAGKACLGDMRDCLEVVPGPCMDYELREAARAIKKLIIEGVNPSDIAIYCSTGEEYRPKAIEIFAEMGVPLRISGGDRLYSIPLVKDLFDLFRFLAEEPNERYFRSLVGSKYLIPLEAAAVLPDENYRLVKLAGQLAKSREPDLYLSSFRQAVPEILVDAPSRDAMIKYISTIEEFPDNCNNQSEWLLAFKTLVNSLHLIDKVKWMKIQSILNETSFMRDVLALQGFIGVIDELIASYRKLDTMPYAEWKRYLISDLHDQLLFKETDLRLKGLQGVNFLSPDMARGQNYHAVFIIGLNEDCFPSVGTGNLLFNFRENTVLNENGINFRYPLWELQRERIRFNSCLGSARKSIFLSYRTGDESDNYIISSPFLDEVALVLGDHFKEIERPMVSMRQRLDYSQEPASWREAMRQMTGRMWRLRSGPGLDVPYLKGISNARIHELNYINHAARMEISRMDNPKFDKYDGLLSSPQLAQSDNDYIFSVSQLNSYAACPFRYFIERVLDLKEEEDGPLGYMNIGSFYHTVLENYYRNHPDPLVLDSARLDSIFEQNVDVLNDGSIPDTIFQSVKVELLNVLQTFLQNDAGVLKYIRDNTNCDMKPALFEQEFELDQQFGNQKIKGFIDRVDLEYDQKQELTGRYIIYDYKTSNAKTLKDCIEGLDYQLPIYHSAVNELLKNKHGIQNPECLALIYYSIKESNRRGIVRKDIKKSLFKGKTGPRDLLGPDNIRVVMKWVEEEADKLVNCIQSGRFMPPRNCPWTNCPFTSVCRHDRQRLAGKEA